MHDPLTFLLALSIAIMRPLGIMLVLPVLSANVIGGAFVRGCVAALLSIPLLPALLADAPLPGPGSLQLFGICAKELMLGALIGVFASVPFWAIDSAGFLIDMMNGSEMGAVYNPMLGDQSSQTGLLLSRALTVLFFTSGGFGVLLSTLYGTYATVPILGAVHLSAAGPPLLGQCVDAIFSLAVRFAIPAIIIMFMVDYGLGLLARAAEGIDVFFLAMPIKSVLGAFVLALSASFGYDLFLHWFMRLNLTVARLLGTLA